MISPSPGFVPKWADLPYLTVIWQRDPQHQSGVSLVSPSAPYKLWFTPYVSHTSNCREVGVWWFAGITRRYSTYLTQCGKGDSSMSSYRQYQTLASAEPENHCGSIIIYCSYCCYLIILILFTLLLQQEFTKCGISKVQINIVLSLKLHIVTKIDLIMFENSVWRHHCSGEFCEVVLRYLELTPTVHSSTDILKNVSTFCTIYWWLITWNICVCQLLLTSVTFDINIMENITFLFTFLPSKIERTFEIY